MPSNSASMQIVEMGSRTAAQPPVLYNLSQFGMHIIVNVTAAPGGQTLTPKLQSLTGSGDFYDLLTGAAISDTGIKVYKCVPGSTGATGFVSNDYVPDIWQIAVGHSGVGAWSYSVSVIRFIKEAA